MNETNEIIFSFNTLWIINFYWAYNFNLFTFNYSDDPLDAFLVPCVALSRNGGRLGHGMGYYDQYFKRYFDKFPNTDHHRTYLIGLAFREQILNDGELPIDENDWKLDFILSG